MDHSDAISRFLVAFHLAPQYRFCTGEKATSLTRDTQRQCRLAIIHGRIDMLHLHGIRSYTRRSAVQRALSRYTSSQASSVYQYLSLYNYKEIEERDLPRLRTQLAQKWAALDVLGRIYIAHEGINAQLILPASNVDAFAQSFPQLFNRQHLNFGAVYETTPQANGYTNTTTNSTIHSANNLQLFDKLDIRIRNQIVADGFNKGHLDLQDSGAALSPDQWHRKLRERNADATESEQTLLLDVRNFYEHEIGRFDGATRIMVDTFRDTFDAVDEILDQHKATHNGEAPREVMMYCTGGIRCEKVGAYLKQHKGIQSIHKLQGGIVKYQQFLKAHPEESSLFKGKNFVFDQRCVGVGGALRGGGHGGDVSGLSAEEVTADVLGKCFQCGAPCNEHTNCSNLMCHGLILQCSDCATQYHGACSMACHDEKLKMDTMTVEQRRLYRKQHAALWKPQNPNVLKYIKFRPVSPEMKESSLSASGQ